MGYYLRKNFFFRFFFTWTSLYLYFLYTMLQRKLKSQHTLDTYTICSNSWSFHFCCCCCCSPLSLMIFVFFSLILFIVCLGQVFIWIGFDHSLIMMMINTWHATTTAAVAAIVVVFFSLEQILFSIDNDDDYQCKVLDIFKWSYSSSSSNTIIWANEIVVTFTLHWIWSDIWAMMMILMMMINHNNSWSMIFDDDDDDDDFNVPTI